MRSVTVRRFAVLGENLARAGERRTGRQLHYIDDNEIRSRAAQRVIDEATALADRARAVRDATGIDHP